MNSLPTLDMATAHGLPTGWPVATPTPPGAPPSTWQAEASPISWRQAHEHGIKDAGTCRKGRLLGAARCAGTSAALDRDLEKNNTVRPRRQRQPRKQVVPMR